MLGPLHGLFILLLDTDRVDRELGCKCQLLLHFSLQVLFENSATFSIVFRAVLIRFSQRGLVHEGRPNLTLFKQLFWVILLPYCTIGIFMAPLKSIIGGTFSLNFRAKICLLQSVSDISPSWYVKGNIIPLIWPVIAIAFCRYWKFKSKQYFKGICPNNKMSSVGNYRRNFVNFDQTLKWIEVHFFYLLFQQVILFSILLTFNLRPQTKAFITHISYVLYWSLYHGMYLPAKMKIPEFPKRRHVSSFFVRAPQFLEPRSPYSHKHVLKTAKSTNWRKKKRKHTKDKKIEVCQSSPMQGGGKGWEVRVEPSQGGKQRKPAEEAQPFKTRLQTDKTLLEVGRGEKRKETKLDEKRIVSQAVPPPLLIHVSPCDAVEQVEETLGPVDPALDPALSQETVSKKMRVGLDNWVRVAREWIVTKPATGSIQGENVADKRRFERRRGERRRSTLIVDLGLQLISTRTDSLAKVDC